MIVLVRDLIAGSAIPALLLKGICDAHQLCQRTVDALYTRLLQGEYHCRTLRLTDGVSLNIGPGEELVSWLFSARQGTSDWSEGY